MMTVFDRVTKTFSDSIDTIIHAAENLPPLIVDASTMMVNSLINEGKILICGNGTSACDAQDFASKLINRHERERPSLPAIALSTDTAVLTSISRDSSYNEVFAKQIRALGTSSDVLFIISSDGKSSSVVQAIQAAHSREMQIIVLSGSDGGDVSRLLQQDNIELRVPCSTAPRIQEAHRLILHCLCDLIDEYLFGQEETVGS